jgi:mRNA degradation ribonuclease J1/J2
MIFPDDILYIIKEFTRPIYMKPIHSDLINLEIKKYNSFKYEKSFYEYYFSNESEFMRRWGWVLTYSNLQNHI